MHGFKKCYDCGRRTVRPIDGQCMMSFTHAKGRSGPRSRSGQTKDAAGSSKRCPSCRENGKHCFISICSCACHPEGRAQRMGLDPESIWRVRGPVQMKHFAASQARARHADHGH